MSDMMERTLASIPRLLSSTLLGGGRGGQTLTKSQSSQSFQNFLKSVDSARGRSEQAALVHRELSRIKEQFNQPDTSGSRWCESFPEIIFCAMLGYDVSFCHIHTLKLAAHQKRAQKRVGYLAATLLLDPTCEITILMTGTLHKDLMSSNMLDNLMALGAAAELISAEHIPMMLPPVVKLLRHRQPMVRAKAVYCMHSFFRRAPSLLLSHVPEVKGMLGDRDPGVLMAVVTTMESLVERSGEQFSDLTMALINILQQIRAYKFPALFSYHGLPLPWLQVKLLKILAHVTPVEDDNTTSSVITLLSHVVRDTVGKEAMSLAILEQSLMTVAALAAGNQKGTESKDSEGLKVSRDLGQELSGEASSYTKLSDTECTSVQPRAEKEEQRMADRDRRMSQWSPLLEEASRCVASFLGADLPNLRYIGMKLLTQLVSVSADLAVPHKDKVVHCLNDPDLIIRRQTLTLLQHMAVPDNYKAVCATMLKHAQKGNVGDKADVIDMVIDISRRLNSDPEWYLHTILPLLAWRLDNARLRFIMNNMLSFFIKTSQDSKHPQFPDLLFTTMVENIMKSEGTVDPSVRFSLYVLRFIPLTGCKTFPSETFLAVCLKMVACDSLTTELRKEVVLCVEALLLRGVLDQEAVSTWARNLMDMVDATTPYHYRFCLSELVRLTSLNTDLTPLSELKSLFVQKTPEKMDFSLSFLDSSLKTVQDNSQPFLKMLQASGVLEVASSELLPQQGTVSSTSAKSEDMSSLSLPSHDGSPLYADVSPCSESGKESGALSPSSALKTVPGVKQRWSKHGFNNNANEKKSLSALSDNTTDDSQTLAEDTEKGNKEDDDLAQALFQGLSPPSSVTQALRPTTKTFMPSQKSSSSSGFDSSSSQNSTGTSGQNTPLVSHGDGDSPPHARVATPSQLAVSPSRPELEPDSEGIVSFPAANSWRALHTAHADHQIENNAEQDLLPSPVALIYVMSSDMESASHLSISDDSLENASVPSIPNSPTQQTPQSHASLLEERGREENDSDETVLSLFLEAQMTENENIQVEHSPEEEISSYETLMTENRDCSSGGDSLYSGFEMLAGCSQDQDSGDIDPDAPAGDEQQT